MREYFFTYVVEYYALTWTEYTKKKYYRNFWRTGVPYADFWEFWRTKAYGYLGISKFHRRYNYFKMTLKL
jgi:hypothetical protein